ncbi:hypothetical protein KW849_01505 [Pseudomonas sp. PDM26]|uniref:hypothetical protein n=1 Tax=Pseudomonas sp. PDM26 TaxID=2854766 RepID=UPI001C485F8A|nr:hypothetical protein [Pseudomonas sp. PDM26]MBV7544984.1 hypothetical protein [Pseudomonas sp. PDM26]
MSDDEIRGRNFILHGRFSSGWNTPWKHDGQGAARTFEDPDYGNYLMMNGKAIVAQAFDTAVFTDAQMEGATYRIAFQYENFGEGENSKVLVITGIGKQIPIDLSGKPPSKPLADWNPFESFAIDGVVAADKTIAVEMHGSASSGSSGLRMTDVDVQLHLVPLQLARINLDGKLYEGQTLVAV